MVNIVKHKKNEKAATIPTNPPIPTNPLVEEIHSNPKLSHFKQKKIVNLPRKNILL
jgi:hypothetical protein